MATLAFHDGTVNMPADLIKYSIILKELSETFAEDEEAIDMPYGTSDEARRAIKAFDTIVRILPDIAKFNAPEGRDVGELEAIRVRLRTAHAEIVALTRDNEVYEWLGLFGDAATTLRTLEDEAFPFSHLRDKNLVEFVGEDVNKTFRVVCRGGCLPVARWLRRLGADVHVMNDAAFVLACANGHLSTAQWLHSLGVDLHAQDDYAFRGACGNGHLETAQWLYSLGDVDIHAHGDLAFLLACEDGHLETAQWLYSVSRVPHGVLKQALAGIYSRPKNASWLRSLLHGGRKRVREDDEAVCPCVKRARA
jgi:hypothetical protein